MAFYFNYNNSKKKKKKINKIKYIITKIIKFNYFKKNYFNLLELKT